MIGPRREIYDAGPISQYGSRVSDLQKSASFQTRRPHHCGENYSLYRENLSLPMSRMPPALLSVPPEVRDFSTTIATNVMRLRVSNLIDTGLSRLNYRIEPIDCFSPILIKSLSDLPGDCARGHESCQSEIVISA